MFPLHISAILCICLLETDLWASNFPLQGTKTWCNTFDKTDDWKIWIKIADHSHYIRNYLAGVYLRVIRSSRSAPPRTWCRYSGCWAGSEPGPPHCQTAGSEPSGPTHTPGRRQPIAPPPRPWPAGPMTPALRTDTRKRTRRWRQVDTQTDMH